MRNVIEKTRQVVGAILLLSLCGVSAAGPTYLFSIVTKSNTTSSLREGPLSIKLFDWERGEKFASRNSGLKASSVADTYFDDGSNPLCRAPFAVPGAFGRTARHRNLPRGNAAPWSFPTTSGQNAGLGVPVQPNGFNPGECGGFTLPLPGFNDPGGNNVPPVTVPAPGAVVLATIGLGCVTFLRKRTGRLLG